MERRKDTFGESVVHYQSCSGASGFVCLCTNAESTQSAPPFVYEQITFVKLLSVVIPLMCCIPMIFRFGMERTVAREVLKCCEFNDCLTSVRVSLSAYN